MLRPLEMTGRWDNSCLMLVMCCYLKGSERGGKEQIYYMCTAGSDTNEDKRAKSLIKQEQTCPVEANNMQR